MLDVPKFKLLWTFLQRNMLIISLTIVWKRWHGHKHYGSSAGDILEEGRCYEWVAVVTLEKQQPVRACCNKERRNSESLRMFDCDIWSQGRRAFIKLSGYMSSQGGAGCISLASVQLASRWKWLKPLLDFSQMLKWTYFLSHTTTRLVRLQLKQLCEMSQEIHLICLRYSGHSVTVTI